MVELKSVKVIHLLMTTQRAERARFVGLFQGCTGLWTPGCWLARRLHQLKASTTMDLGISIFLIFVRCVALRNLELLIKTVGTYWSDLLLKTLVVGRRQQSESIEAALDMEERRFDEQFCCWSVPSLVESHNFLSRFGSLFV